MLLSFTAVASHFLLIAKIILSPLKINVNDAENIFNNILGHHRTNEAALHWLKTARTIQIFVHDKN